MHKRTFISVFIFLSAIVATGCTTSGAIGIDGRISNLNELADRISYKYHGGLSNVKNSPPNLKHHRHYGDFAMTLFNVRAGRNDVPDMINSFRNYCSYIGGFQRDVRNQAAKSDSFSLICEPNEVYGKVKDPAYFLFFVNVLLSPSSLSNTHAAGAHSTDKHKKVETQKKVVPDHTHPDHTHPSHTHSNKGGHTHKTKFDNTNRRNPHSDNANHQSNYLIKTHHKHSYPSNVLAPSTHHGHKKHSHGGHHGYKDWHHSKPHAAIKQNVNPYYLVPRNKNPYYNAPRNTPDYHTIHKHKRASKGRGPKHKKVYKAKGYCVNFLISENQTHSTVFTHMPNYEDYRKRFEAVLESTKNYC